MEMAAFGEKAPLEGVGSRSDSLGRRASHACWESPKTSQRCVVPRRSSLATVQPCDYNGTKDGARPYVITYVLPEASEDRRLSYSEQASRMSAALRAAPGRLLEGGTLLHTSERGVMFPVIHLSDHPEAVRRVQQRLFKDNADIPLGTDYVLHQGLYKEVRKVYVDNDPSAFSSLQPSTNNSKGYILIGFKSLDRNFDQLMVETWKEWTGVRSLELYLPPSLGLSCIRFFLRQGAEAHLFMYVVLAECSTGAATPEHHLRLLDFAQRMRVERMSGYISVYRPLRLFPAPPPTLAIWEDACPSSYASYGSPSPSRTTKGQLHALNGVSSAPPKVEI